MFIFVENTFQKPKEIEIFCEDFSYTAGIERLNISHSFPPPFDLICHQESKDEATTSKVIIAELQDLLIIMEDVRPAAIHMEEPSSLNPILSSNCNGSPFASVC